MNAKIRRFFDRLFLGSTIPILGREDGKLKVMYYEKIFRDTKIQRNKACKHVIVVRKLPNFLIGESPKDLGWHELSDDQKKELKDRGSVAECNEECPKD